MTFARRPASTRGRLALVFVAALLLLAACSSDDDPGAATDDGSGDTVAEDDGTTTDNGDYENEDKPKASGEDEGEGEDDESTEVEGATAKQQGRIDSGKPTLLIRAPEAGATVASPVKMEFEVLNGNIVENSADESGYVVFVIASKGSMQPIYDDEAEIQLTKNGRTKIKAMLGGQKGPIQKTLTSVNVVVEGAEPPPEDPAG